MACETQVPKMVYTTPQKLPDLLYDSANEGQHSMHCTNTFLVIELAVYRFDAVHDVCLRIFARCRVMREDGVDTANC